eukprot:TRINITY_DN6858_c0_g1_i1.p1 TRINITY_DN6858_c0_g1~~TRINITY_DN6858_c0_g1_i1.p1  ORF type:complete len:306 (-),score=69.72 TRINITY_DN6858_c0_g1_i1:284-1201(-)
MLDSVVDVVKAFGYTFLLSIINFVRLFIPDSYFYKNIKGENVLITGAGSGIGRLMALKLAKQGGIMVLWDMNTKGNEETAEMIRKEGGKAFTYTVDVSKREVINEFADKVTKEVGDITILVNNAGIVSGTPLLDTPDQKIIKTFEVNVFSHFWTMKYFLPKMIEMKKGHITNVASLAGYSGTNKLVDYCSSKFADVGLDEAFRVELFVQGHSDYIKTTCICPYYISTGMFAGVQSKLIPILEPEYVAQKAVDGILCDKEIVMLPGWCCLLVAIKALIPPAGFMRLSQAFGFNCSMDQFSGRKKAD